MEERDQAGHAGHGMAEARPGRRDATLSGPGSASTLPEEVVHDPHPLEHDEHAGHVDHTGHQEMFRRRFWISLVLTIPVLVFSPLLQRWLGFTPPTFAGSEWIGPLFSIVAFLCGGLPFLQMAIPELRSRSPGMMTLISLTITTTLGARNGLLIRDRLALERAREVDIVLFDMTGTLTEGQQGIVGFAAAGDW